MDRIVFKAAVASIAHCTIEWWQLPGHSTSFDAPPVSLFGHGRPSDAGEKVSQTIKGAKDHSQSLPKNDGA